MPACGESSMFRTKQITVVLLRTNLTRKILFHCALSVKKNLDHIYQCSTLHPWLASIPPGRNTNQTCNLALHGIKVSGEPADFAGWQGGARRFELSHWKLPHAWLNSHPPTLCDLDRSLSLWRAGVTNAEQWGRLKQEIKCECNLRLYNQLLINLTAAPALAGRGQHILLFFSFLREITVLCSSFV